MKRITIEVPDGCEVRIVRKEEEKKEPIIRTYQDLISNEIKIKGYAVDGHSCINSISEVQACYLDKHIAASEKVAKSMLAMAMISQLIPYYGGALTEEEWNNSRITKYIIRRNKNKVELETGWNMFCFLAFHTPEQRDEFFKYNEQLVKDYLMID